MVVRSEIEQIAVTKYRASGYGIQYKDIMKFFHVSKEQAQRTLKHFHQNKVLFTAGDLIHQGILFLRNKNPQQYFPSCIKAELLENLKKRNIFVNGAGIDPSNVSTLSSGKYAHSNALEYQKASTFLDVLLLLPFSPPYIHKLQFILRVDKPYYNILNSIKKTKEIHEEVIGKRYVKYLFSSNGKIEIFVTSNNSPFRIEIEEDEIAIFSFLGQVRDRLLHHVSDIRELFIPFLLDWVLVQCDLNKDIQIDEKAQITLPGIQLRHADRIFREYVKIINGKAFYRVEESLRLNKVLSNALDNIVPYRSIERKIDELPKMIEELISQKIYSIIGVNPEKFSDKRGP